MFLLFVDDDKSVSTQSRHWRLVNMEGTKERVEEKLERRVGPRGQRATRPRNSFCRRQHEGRKWQKWQKWHGRSGWLYRYTERLVIYQSSIVSRRRTGRSVLVRWCWCVRRGRRPLCCLWCGAPCLCWPTNGTKYSRRCPSTLSTRRTASAGTRAGSTSRISGISRCGPMKVS